MGLRVVVFREPADDYGDQGALLWCSTSGIPLPIESFGTADEALTFLQWLDEDKEIDDARSLPWEELRDLQLEWWTLNGTIPA